jgi:hypothetical protein
MQLAANANVVIPEFAKRISGTQESRARTALVAPAPGSPRTAWPVRFGRDAS